MVIFGPWWVSLVRDLMAERQARALAEERAQMAAHVHDSVLQTLALIQRSSDDPRQVVRLARGQERELRAWLFEGRAPGTIGDEATTLAEGVGLLQRQVEDDHGITVQVVMVGECALTDGLRALLDAAREATVNAAKWSGAPQVSLYAEVEPDVVMLFVRDRGRGFDPDRVPERPPGHRPIDPGPHGSLRWHGGHPILVRRGDRSRALHAQSDGLARSHAGAPMSEAARPRIFLVEDHAVFRAGVRAELGDAVEVVGEADEVGPAIEMINERVPDVVLLDVHLPGGGGQAVLRGVLPLHPGVRFLALSVSDAPEDVIAVIRAGARGYITKTISGGELLQAVYRVGAGDAVFSPRLAGFVLDAFSQGTATGTVTSGLDPELDQLSPERATGAPADRPGVHVQGGCPGPDHLRQDGRIARLVGLAQAPALDEARTHPLGHRSSARLEAWTS